MEYSKEHIEAVELLIEKYRSITKEMVSMAVKEAYGSLHVINFSARIVANILTGFGSKKSCLLCLSVQNKQYLGYTAPDCRKCINSIEGYLSPCALHDTYQFIARAKTNKGLIKAFKDRADYLENKLKEIRDGAQ